MAGRSVGAVGSASKSRGTQQNKSSDALSARRNNPMLMAAAMQVCDGWIGLERCTCFCSHALDRKIFKVHVLVKYWHIFSPNKQFFCLILLPSDGTQTCASNMIISKLPGRVSLSHAHAYVDVSYDRATLPTPHPPQKKYLSRLEQDFKHLLGASTKAYTYARMRGVNACIVRSYVHAYSRAL